jgi:hypothetical protein
MSFLGAPKHVTPECHAVLTSYRQLAHNICLTWDDILLAWLQRDLAVKDNREPAPAGVGMQGEAGCQGMACKQGDLRGPAAHAPLDPGTAQHTRA